MTCYFLLAVVSVHIIRTDLSIWKDAISRYAVGSFGLLVSSGLLAIGSAEVITGFFHMRQSTIRLPRTAGFVLLFCGLGICLAAFFPLDLDLSQRTLSGILHDCGALVQFGGFPVALFLWHAQIATSAHAAYTRLIAFITFILGLAIGYMSLFATGHNYFGLIQKITVGLMVSWLGWQAYTLASTGSAALPQKEEV
ncbi:MAG TPA: DUF998 domain-containing protein [bacterium]|nr:DUF998 domain-containing protein [bacterium]